MPDSKEAGAAKGKMNHMNRAAIAAYLKEHREAHLEKIQEFLRQPSISAENVGVRECADLLASYYRSLGCQEVAIVETGGHPGVWAYYDAGAPKTLVNYAMYDVQPVVGEQWSSPPFDARIVELPGMGKAIVARGAINSKGPYRMWLNALESIIAVEGRLPVNIMFTAEGEEELGSPHLPAFIERYVSRLQTADALFIAGAHQDLEGKVNLSLGVKGLVYFELECSGETWGRGPLSHDIHSSMKAVVDSPVWRLIEAMNTMVADGGNIVAIDGINDDVAPPSAEDLALVDELEKHFDDQTWKRAFQVGRWTDDLSGRELLLRYLYSPTLNIDGLWSGYMGPGTKTVLPARASCKIDVRLVPNQHAAQVLSSIRAHLDRRGFTDIRIQQLSAYDWAKTSVQADVVQTILQTYQDYGVQRLVWPHIAGSAPFYLYSRKPPNLPIGRAGLGHGARMHSPNEYLLIDGTDRVAGLVECEQFFVDFLYRYAEKAE